MSVLAVEFGSIFTQFSQRVEDSTTRAIDFYEKYVTEKLCLAEMHIDQVAKFKGLPAQRIRLPEEKRLSPPKKNGTCSFSLKKMKRSSKVKVIEDFNEKSLINSLQKDLLQLDLDLNGSIDHRVNILGYEDSFHDQIYDSGNKENEDQNEVYESKSKKSRDRCEGVHVQKENNSAEKQGHCGNQAVRKSLIAQFSEIKVKDKRQKESDRIKFQEKVDAIDFERVCNSLNPSQADAKEINNNFQEEEVIITQLEINVGDQNKEETKVEESEQLYETNLSESEENKNYVEEFQENKKKSSQCRLDDYVHKELTQEERMNRDIEQWNRQLDQASQDQQEGQIHFADQGKNNENNYQQNKKRSSNLTGQLYSEGITENSGAEQVNEQEKPFENDSSDLCLLIEGQSDSNHLVTLPAENTRKGQFVLKQSEQFQDLDGQLDQENTDEYEMTDYSSNESSNAGSPVFAWIDRIPANFSAPQLEKHHQNIFDAGIFASQNHHTHAHHNNPNSSNSNSQLTYPQSQNYGSTQMEESLFGQQPSQVGSNTNYLWQSNNPKFGSKQQQPMMSQQSQQSAASQNDNMKYCQSEMFSQNTFGFGFENGLFEEDSFKEGINFSNYSQFLKNDQNNKQMQQYQSQPQLQHYQSQNMSQQQQYYSNESSQQQQFTQNSNQILLQSPQKLKTEKQRKQLYCNNKAVPSWAEDLKKVSEQVRVQNAQKVLDPIVIFGHFAVENLNLRVVFKNTGKRYDEGRGSSANWRQDYTPEQIESLINATSHTPNKKKQSKFTSFLQNSFNSIKKKLL